MNNVELTQHLVLLEERLKAIEDAQNPNAMSLVAARLQDIQATLGQLVPPRDVRASMAEATEHQAAMADAAPLQAEQLKGIVTTLDEQLPAVELRDKLQNELFFVRQLISVMQGTRDDVVAMRSTLMGLSRVLEQVLRARVDDDERQWRIGDVERRRAG